MAVDIHDVYNPILITIFQINKEEAFQIEYAKLPSNGKEYLVINTFTGIRGIPLNSDVTINE